METQEETGKVFSLKSGPVLPQLEMEKAFAR
jgi:hypothetical protein